MVRSTVEVMAKEEKGSKNNLATDFNKKWGTVSKKHYYDTQEAIRNGEDISLLSNRKASQKEKQTDIIKGAEIKEWGLDINSLLVTEAPYDQEHDVDFYARNIL